MPDAALADNTDQPNIAGEPVQEAAALPMIDAIPDPGCLPAWNLGELTPPRRLGFRTLLALIGPGIVLAGGSIGTGEWVMGPQAAARYHGALMIVVLLSILSQVILNTEAMRYTFCTGEPVMTGFLRTRPGPRFWLVVYLLLDFGSWWPSQAGLAAQIFVVMVKGLTPADTIDPNTVRYASYAVFTLCAAMALFGGKVYNTIELVASGKFLFTLAFLLFCCLFFVSLNTWGEIWGGLIDPARIPRDANGNAAVDWKLIGALAGYAGVGGLANIMASNFVREKGWGMGKYVGAIPSAFGGHNIKLSHIGTMCRPTTEARSALRRWMRRLIIDQWLIWGVGSLVAMLLPCMMGAQFLRNKSLASSDQWRWAAALAQDFGSAVSASHTEALGNVLMTLTLICGLIIMIPGQFYTIDNTARRWTDALWSSSKRLRGVKPHNVKYVYYTFAGAFVVFGFAAYTFFPKMSASTMMVIAGNACNLAIAASIVHTMYVNVRFLPRSLRPGLVKQTAMGLSATFFLTMFIIVIFTMWATPAAPAAATTQPTAHPTTVPAAQ